MIKRILKKQGKISINAISSFVQVVIVGICYFFLYKYLLRSIGAKELGLWSLIIASSSVANMGNMGIGGSVVKFVAAADANKDFKKIITIIHTGIVTILITVGVLTVILYFILPIVLRSVITPDLHPLALDLIPFALLSLILNACANVFTAAIDGVQFIYLKNFIISFLTFVYLILAVFLCPQFGLLGVAYAQVIQAVLMLISAIIVIHFKIPGFNIFRFKIERLIFKELFSYGLKYQVISISALFFDPITKFFVTKYAGLNITAYYEMANKLLSQLLALIVSSLKVIVPAIANLYEKGRANIKHIYIKYFPYLFVATIMLITIILAFSRYISVIWIGKDIPVFSYILTIISCGWVFNIITVLAFYINLGTGQLKWNVLSSISLGLFNIILSYLFGYFFGSYYTLIGATLSLIISSGIIFIPFCKKYDVRLVDIFNIDSLYLIVISIAGILVSNYFFETVKGVIPFILLLFMNLLIIFSLLYFSPGTRIIKRSLLTIFKKD